MVNILNQMQTVSTPSQMEILVVQFLHYFMQACGIKTSQNVVSMTGRQVSVDQHWLLTVR